MMKYIDYCPNTHACILSETATPELAPGEILCKVAAFGINRADLLQKQGKYPPPPGTSTILGMELSGIVMDVADPILSHLLDKPVCAMVTGGAYAEYVKLPASHIIPVEGNMPLVDCAGLPEVFLTAYQALLTIARLKPGAKVLIHAGASGVGTAAIQLAVEAGARVACTTSSTEKNAACKALGAEIAINYRTESFDKVLKTAKFHPDVIVDVVGEGHIQKNLNIAALDCVIVQLAMMGGRFISQLDMAKMLGKRITWQASTLRNRSDEYKTHLVNDFLAQFGDKLLSGKISPVIDKIFAAKDINQAHEYMAQNKNIGKLIVTW